MQEEQKPSAPVLMNVDHRSGKGERPCVLMNVDHRSGKGLETPPPSCRDKGRTWGWVGAWCLSWSPHDSCGCCGGLARCRPHAGQAPGPSSTPPAPLSLQDAGALPFPDLIVKIRQDVSASIAEFDCHYSLSSLVDSRSILLKSIVCINSLDLTTKRH